MKSCHVKVNWREQQKPLGGTNRERLECMVGRDSSEIRIKWYNKDTAILIDVASGLVRSRAGKEQRRVESLAKQWRGLKVDVRSLIDGRKTVETSMVPWRIPAFREKDWDVTQWPWTEKHKTWDWRYESRMEFKGRSLCPTRSNAWEMTS